MTEKEKKHPIDDPLYYEEAIEQFYKEMENYTKEDTERDKRDFEMYERECPEKYSQCKYYHPELNVESRCIKDSNIRYCIKEIGVE